MAAQCLTLTVVVASSSALAAPTENKGDLLSDWLVARGIVGGDNSIAQNIRNRASEMVVSAVSFLGVPYKFGGNTADAGFDCSGFTRYVFEHSLGLILPRRADQQATAAGLVNVSVAELKAGDLVFFNTMKRAFSHVGIYIGDNKFIHAPRSGAFVRVEDMRVSYWLQRFDGARRAPGMSGQDAGIAVESAPITAAQSAKEVRFSD